MSHWIVGVGAVLILGAVQEVFQDLFHPSQRGALSDKLGRGVFSLLRRWPRLLPLAGPLTLVTVIASWIVLIAVGFALIYLDAFPVDFRTNTGALPPDLHRFWSSFYFSMEAISTLGMGDLSPAPEVLRLLATLEALLGFGLLTASVSWIVLLYPALARMRLLARSVSILVEAEQAAGTKLAETESDIFLSALARDVVRTRVDLVHFPIIYYFATVDKRASVAYSLTELVRIAGDGLQAHHSARVRLAAASLEQGLNDLAAILAERFLTASSPARKDVFGDYGTDHLTS